MSVITPRSSAKFTHSISLIFSGFLESHDHPRDPVRWSLTHVSIFLISNSRLKTSGSFDDPTWPLMTSESTFWKGHIKIFIFAYYSSNFDKKQILPYFPQFSNLNDLETTLWIADVTSFRLTYYNFNTFALFVIWPSMPQNAPEKSRKKFTPLNLTRGLQAWTKWSKTR